MTLSFSTQIDGKPTYFIEKIWSGIHENHLSSNSEGLFYSDMGKIFDNYSTLAPKIHTIRADKKDRWKVGNKIHFVINNRTKNRFQFAPVIPVKSIQKIEIVYWMGCGDYPSVVVGGQTLKNSEVETLAKNDGFDSVEDFFAWFNSDFKGKIIHWTDFRY